VAPSNFNYQVELNKGLQSLKQGRLRQAEQSFKYLVDKFPGAEGGYRGLAKVHFEQEDRASALRVLRDGAAAVTKAGERSAAIGLLREAVSLDPKDLATHRRLAATLALAGDLDGAVQEYARFVGDLRQSGETERAKNEIAYAKGQLRGAPNLGALDEIAAGTQAKAETVASSEERIATPPAPPTDGAPAMDPWSMPRPEPKPTFTPPPQAEVGPDDPWASPPPTTYPPASYERSTVQEITLENDPWASPTFASSSAPPSFAGPEPAPAPESAPPAAGAPADTEEWTPQPAAEQMNGDPRIEEDPVGVEAVAARYLATRDPRAAKLALDAAQHYIDQGHTDAASDLLLQLISAGVADHDAQRLLIAVTRTLGKREVASVKAQLLVRALRLDGRDDLVAEVEALTQGE
jgi:tetratricopeptide (TPR) repeat protein